MSFPLIRSFNTDAGSMIAEDEPIYLVIEPGLVEEAVRDLVRIGLDDIRGWCDASDLEVDRRAWSTVDGAHRRREIAAMLDDAARAGARRSARGRIRRQATLPRAINIAHTRLADRLDEVPKRQASGRATAKGGIRSARACAFLQRKGYEVINLQGGMLAWEQARETVQR